MEHFPKRVREPGRDPVPGQALRMLLSNLQDKRNHNTGSDATKVNRQVLLSLKDALDSLITTLYDASNPRKVSWSYFKGLVTQLKQLTIINDTEYPGIGEEEVGKFRFGVLLPQASPEGPFPPPTYHISFKPKGTTSLNKTLCSLLYLITGPIKVQGKLPTKNFDGPSQETRIPDIEKLNYKRKVSEILFDHFMSAAESHWTHQSEKTQQQLCKSLVDALKLLFLYWGYYLCLEKKLHLCKNDRRELKLACQEQLKQNTLFCTEEQSIFSNKFPLYIVSVDLVDDSSHSRRGSPSRQRTNSVVYDGTRSERHKGTGSNTTHTVMQRRVTWACFCNPADRKSQDQAGYYSGKYTRGCTCNSATKEPEYHSSCRQPRIASSKI